MEREHLKWRKIRVSFRGLGGSVIVQVYPVLRFASSSWCLRSLITCALNGVGNVGGPSVDSDTHSECT